MHAFRQQHCLVGSLKYEDAEHALMCGHELLEAIPCMQEILNIEACLCTL